ncbi:hypothetical protein QTP88_001593 [Uroleucon formosanum]
MLKTIPISAVSKKKLFPTKNCNQDDKDTPQYSKPLNLVEGFEDLGHLGRTNKPAFQALVFLARDFVMVDSTTDLNLSEVLFKQLKLYKIKIENCRGQAYDNGSNMSGRYQGVQTGILNINSRAFFTPCAVHNLNLVLCDVAKNSTIAITFFGIVRRVYTLFSASTYCWSVIKKHCTVFTIKRWSETRWKSHINSMKALRFQLSSILNALEEVLETANDLMARSEDVSLSDEIGKYEFILNLVIWYILTEANIFLHQYRENRFNLATISATKLAEEANIAVAFKNPRVRKKRKLFDYENIDEPVLNNEEQFHNDPKDIDGLDLFSKLTIFRSLVDEDTNSFEAINILKTTNGSFPNLSIALRIMLSIPVTSACQDKLSELALISTEEAVSSTIDYKHLIYIFALKTSRKKMFN